MHEDPNDQIYIGLQTPMSIKKNTAEAISAASKRNFHLRTIKKRQKVKEFLLPTSFLS